jgi:gamma-glutamylcyclotransferase (GGCT)/AIG2-like uncharacterized protein YtfP
VPVDPQLMGELIFFYGTLMSGFELYGRARPDARLKPAGRGSIGAALFDLGSYPAAITTSDSRVRGELYQLLDVEAVLAVLDEIEGYIVTDPVSSLYTREKTLVTPGDGGEEVVAWVYFYNAPLGGRPRIESGDYLEYLQLG